MRTNQLIATGAACLGLAIATSTCSSSKPTPAPAQALWGEMKPVVSVKELMRDLLDPLADNIFDAVGSVIDEKGVQERSPKTEADWDKIRIGGVAMAEGSYLLKIPRPFAPAGDLNNSTGPDPSELSPTQILAKLEADPVEWNARIEALRNVGLQVIDIVKRKSVDELWDASQNLDDACENCHKSYWYPAEDNEFYRKLDRKLLELPGQSSRPAGR
jgi:hypothetical protein